MEYIICYINLKKIQKKQLKILLEFDRICDKHDIKYILFAGTLLGAVRHNGFIPWDDDIDVALLRKDYKKFIQVCKNDLKENYFLQTFNSDREYNKQFAKLRENNTTYLEKNMSECNIHHGLFIDIFPLDNVKPNTLLGKFQQKSCYFLYAFETIRIKKNCNNINNLIKQYLALILHFITLLIPETISNRVYYYLLNFFNKKNTKYISHLTNNPTKKKFHRFLIEKQELDEIIFSNFEGYKFPIPKNYNKILKKIYNDYMSYPPKEEQKPRHNINEIKI